MKFYSFDLDPDPMTLILKLDLDIIKMYVSSYLQQFKSCHLNRHADRQIRLKLLPTAYADGKYDL